MSNEYQKAYKARNLRYRRAALEIMRQDTLADELEKIADECAELEWSIEDDETLVDVFDGDTDEIGEFRMMFSDLSYKCERLYGQLYESCVTEHFDDFFVGSLGSAYQMVGYDGYEEDYFSLTSFEAGWSQTVSRKRLMKLTKDKLISVAGQCIGVMMSFLDIQHSYDCLKAVFDALRDDRTELMKNVKTIEDVYEETQDDSCDLKLESQILQRYESLLSCLPDRIWVE